MRRLVLIFCLVTLTLASRNRNSIGNSAREGKLFSLFSVVNFRNDPCVSSSSIASGSTNYRNGTCYTSTECTDKGGSAKGGCAAGFGVCCVFTISDTSSSIGQNDTYLQNPGYPSTYSGTGSSISYTVNKLQDDVSWLRLDFETFTLKGPADTVETSGGACTDKFTVTVTSGQTIPEICGQNTGQHIYVDMGTGNSVTATIAFTFSGTSTSRKWEVKVAQIVNGVAWAPPDGCLQYSMGLTGQIKTFNFQDASSSTHLANQRYNHCIRQEAGFCCVQYSACSDTESFTLGLINDAGTVKASQGATCLQMTTNSEQTADYILIQGSQGECQPGVTSGATGTRYCGERLNPTKDATTNVPVCDCSGPFYVGIYTDIYAEAKSATVHSRGACLEYRQVSC